MKTKTTELDEDTTYAKEILICAIGDTLKEARLKKNLSHDHIIEELKFNILFLEALESGNWSDMPGDIYALGFLRQYAEFLHIDVSDDIQRIKTNKYELTKPLTYPDAAISPNKTWGTSATLIFILVIIVSNLVDMAEDSPAPQAHIMANITISPQDKYTQVQVAANPLLTSHTDAYAFSEAQMESSPLLAASQTNNNKKEASTHQTFTFFAASDDVWLQVYQELPNQKPKLLREASLKATESFSIEKRQTTLLLTTGKPLALEVSMNGHIIFARGSLGQKGKVLKLFPISQ